MKLWLNVGFYSTWSSTEREIACANWQRVMLEAMAFCQWCWETMIHL